MCSDRTQTRRGETVQNVKANKNLKARFCHSYKTVALFSVGLLAESGIMLYGKIWP